MPKHKRGVLHSQSESKVRKCAAGTGFSRAHIIVKEILEVAVGAREGEAGARKTLQRAGEKAA